MDVTSTPPVQKQTYIDARSLGLSASLACFCSGHMYVPNFPMGLSVGVANLIINSILRYFVETVAPLPVEESECAAKYKENILHSTVLGPIVEELIFRGYITLTKQWELSAFEETAVLFLHPVTLVILISSLCFGAGHLVNQHNRAYRQAAYATLSGMVYGFLALQFGLAVPIAAHMINNFLVLLALLAEEPTQTIHEISEDAIANANGLIFHR